VDAVVTIAEVMSFDTRSGNKRFVVRDGEGKEYTTFRESIGAEAKRYEGSRARIEFHENQRGQYTNVYLDKVEPAPEAPGGGAAAGGADPDEAAWRTAVEAAPWLVGESEPQEEVPPEELYEKLRPFKELVAEDIEAYETVARRLAEQPGLLQSVRTTLARNAPQSLLFDTDRFRRNMEAAFTGMWERWQRGESPRGFNVESLA